MRPKCRSLSSFFKTARLSAPTSARSSSCFWRAPSYARVISATSRRSFAVSRPAASRASAFREAGARLLAPPGPPRLPVPHAAREYGVPVVEARETSAAAAVGAPEACTHVLGAPARYGERPRARRSPGGALPGASLRMAPDKVWEATYQPPASAGAGSRPLVTPPSTPRWMPARTTTSGRGQQTRARYGG